MKVDTRAEVSMLLQKAQEALFPVAVLKEATMSLYTYTAEPM